MVVRMDILSVPIKIHDETIRQLQRAAHKARIDNTEKLRLLKSSMKFQQEQKSV